MLSEAERLTIARSRFPYFVHTTDSLHNLDLAYSFSFHNALFHNIKQNVLMEVLNMFATPSPFAKDQVENSSQLM